jgi:25S rRNA (uracil2843-N3)-methyltransferase
MPAPQSKKTNKPTKPPPQKPAPPTTNPPPTAVPHHHHLPPPLPHSLQQLLLTLFHSTFSHRFTPSLPSLLQSVKHHLFLRDFASAFGSPDFLEAYAVRWSPSRALAYAHIFADVLSSPSTSPSSGPTTTTTTPGRRKKIVCFGGGAGAELVALGAWAGRLGGGSGDGGGCEEEGVQVQLVDVAAWEDVLGRLYDGLVKPPSVSRYAAAHVRAAHAAPVVEAGRFGYSFLCADVLGLAREEVEAVVGGGGGGVELVTVMFTLNELFGQSVARTNALLLMLKGGMAVGACLLVVDSAGSYAEVKLNGSQRRYPMQWLLDHTMLQQEEGESQWEKVRGEESVWFRIGEGLKYPLELENMRYQLHLYRRIS